LGKGLLMGSVDRFKVIDLAAKYLFFIVQKLTYVFFASFSFESAGLGCC
jgi:hypothetical protein